MNRAKFFIAFTFLLAFAVCVSAQSVQFPSELKGYRFFGNGKLKTLQIGISTKENVKSIFGQNCEDDCDYNSNWKVRFIYFSEDECFTSQTGNEPKQNFCLDKKYIGKLSSVELKPKNTISFSKFSFSNFGGNGVGSSISEDGKGRGTSIFYRSFSFIDGITYNIFDEVDSTEKNLTDLKKGDLFSIEYELSKKLKKRIFIKQK